jgi:putative IMPACT (imprinted ancient) family translation regulator
VERSSDAGEPAGSAGAPILQVIKGRGLHNLVVVVVRYFGGTKLGIGGLARAYREAAKSALDAGEVRQREPARRLRVVLPLALVGEARSQLARLGGEVVSEAYALEVAELCVTVGVSRADELRRSLDEVTRGAARWPAGEEMPGGRS